MPPMEKSLSPVECAEVRQFFRFLLDTKDKIGKFDINKALKSYVLTNAGVNIRRQKNNVWSPELIADILAQRSAGISYKDIAEQVGTSVRGVYGAVYRYTSNNFDPRYRRKKQCG